MALVILPLMPIVAWIMRKIDPRAVLVAGFILTSCALFYIARNLNLSISQKDASIFVIYEAIGMSLVFVPVTTIAYHGVAGERNNEISSLLNFGRTLGGSIGISFATTALVRGAQVHQGRLADHITSYSPLLRNYKEAYHAALSSSGASLEAGRAAAAANLYHTVVNQAVVLSYLDLPNLRVAHARRHRTGLSNDPPAVSRQTAGTGPSGGCLTTPRRSKLGFRSPSQCSQDSSSRRKRVFHSTA